MTISDHTGFLRFLVSATVLAVIPGPGIIYVLARTLSGGKQDGIASTLGTFTGGLVHILGAAIGLSALLAASADAFRILNYAGAVYLLCLGVRTLTVARTRNLGVVFTRPKGPRRAFFEGIPTEVLNAKTALFFLAFVPRFVDHRLAVAPQIVRLGLICVTLNAGVDILVVFLAWRLTPYLRSPRSARVMSYGSGSVMIGLGASLMLDQSKR